MAPVHGSSPGPSALGEHGGEERYSPFRLSALHTAIGSQPRRCPSKLRFPTQPGAEGFEMQSSGDFSPAPGSSSIAKPGTQARFPSLVVIPTSRRAIWLFYISADLSKSFTLGHGRRVLDSPFDCSYLIGAGRQRGTTAPIAQRMENGETFPGTSPNSAPLTFRTRNKCCRLQMPAEQEGEGNGGQALSEKLALVSVCKRRR